MKVMQVTILDITRVNFINLAHNFCWWSMQWNTHNSFASKFKEFNSDLIFVTKPILLLSITGAPSVETQCSLLNLRWYSVFYFLKDILSINSVLNWLNTKHFFCYTELTINSYALTQQAGLYLTHPYFREWLRKGPQILKLCLLGSVLSWQQVHQYVTVNQERQMVFMSELFGHKISITVTKHALNILQFSHWQQNIPAQYFQVPTFS
jgi:hypothetical protein